jgi:hypothetical protein
MTSFEPPAEVVATTSQYLELIDKALPDQVVGLYLTADDLASPPDPGKPVVFTLDGVFKEAQYGGPVGPVLWSEMARQSVAVRSTPGLVVHDDQQALVDHTRGNLTLYWEPSLDQLVSGTAELPDDELIPDWVLPWFVLGVPRQHALLATGNIVSKTGAGEHALTAFPEWSGLINRCLDHRAGQPIKFTAADAKSAVTFGRQVITSALTL